MESLTRTPFFCMILQQNDTSTIETLSPAYKEFMSQLVHVCANVTRDIPAFFTLNYTHVELIALKEEYKARGVKKKYLPDTICSKLYWLLKALSNGCRFIKPITNPICQKRQKSTFHCNGRQT